MGIESTVTQVGLDCHKNFSRLTARDAARKVVLRQRLEHDDREGLREDLSRFPAGTPVVLEGTFGWDWMSDEICASRLDPHLGNSRKIAGWRAARGIAKNNKLDADLLSELWSEPERWWEVWLAPPEVRDQREWLRYRVTLVKMQTSLKNRVHATLHRHGILHPFSDLFGKKGQAFLKGLCEGGIKKGTGAGAETSKMGAGAGSAGASGVGAGGAGASGVGAGGAGASGVGTGKPALEPAAGQAPQSVPAASGGPLRESGRRTLAGYLKLLAQVRGAVAAATREIRGQVLRSEEGERWRSLPGVSFILAYTLMAEVGYSSRFPHHRHLASYALLAPQDDDSGDEEGGPAQGRHVGRVGRRTLKWAFIEAAHGAVRKSAHFREIFDRRTGGGKRDRGRGFIVVARELCRVGFSCCRNERDYAEERPPRPGSKEATEAKAELLVKQQNQMRLKRKELNSEAHSAPRQAARPGMSEALDAKPALPTEQPKPMHPNRKELNGEVIDSSMRATRPGTGGPEDPMVAAAAVKRRRT
jgi:transposase